MSPEGQGEWTRDGAAHRPQTLEFSSDPGASRAAWIALAILVAIIGWMGSGMILPAPEETEAPAQVAQDRRVTVAVRESRAGRIEQVFVAEGQALPDRDTPILAEMSGNITAVEVARGAAVAEGAPIARFDPSRLEADRAQAEESLARARREFENAEALRARGSATLDRVTDARAALAAAEADLAAAGEELARAVVRAPFAGRIEEMQIDPGEYVSTGDPVARIVDNEPLTVAIRVPQQTLSQIREGQPASVAFITGETAEGTVRFVGTSADAQTRTFAAEIEVANEGGAIPAGLSAQVRIPVGEAVAHFISPAILSLGTDGSLGVKSVDADGKVVFHLVRIERAQTDGIWVSGLPEELTLITIGQGFVNEGETVDPQPEALLATGAEAAK